MNQHEAGCPTCPHCGKQIVLDAVVVTLPPPTPMPEQMFDLKVASELIPYRPPVQLSQWLNRRKDEFPPRYRTLYMGSRARSTRIRILSATEIWKIRSMVLKGAGKLTQ